MKLKILPPTLRLNNRYLVLEIKSNKILTKDELVAILWDGAIRFYGELETSNFNIWVMRFFDCSNEFDKFKNLQNDFYFYKSVVRCQRGLEEKFRGGALAMINMYKRNKIAISTIGISGTIKSAVNKFILNE
ncbi:Rpp14/Pop5 family protein [Methanobrevibacter curvatus]|uniref:Ribonuclease P protein component 2 n=1 Tax=Methanobrevibacter curvatus TaxID=49547 RepID=A0A166AZA7_9EURY|nr:Rpp14/Pop5 family protein [Methanobrevibacter curvatus]KZX12662.1 ribonuclease P protein component 2 [Methanobrevibacter curvatus]